METRPIGNAVQNEQRTATPRIEPASARPPAAPPVTANPVQQAAVVPDLDQVAEAVRNINKTMQALSQDLEFSVDADSNRTIVKVVDQQTKEVIRQMPTAEALEIAKALDRVQGLLIRQKA